MSKEPQAIGQVIAALLRDRPVRQQVDWFISSDMNYLTCRNRLRPMFVGRCLRIFGEAVVLESLRRVEPGWCEDYVFGVMRNVERQYAQA